MHRIQASLATALSLQGIVGSAGDFSCEEVVVILQREKKMFVHLLSDLSGLPMWACVWDKWMIPDDAPNAGCS